MRMNDVLQHRVVVTNVVYAVALVVAALLMRPDAALPASGLMKMLGTGAAVFGLFDIGLAVVYGAGYATWKDALRAQGIIVALLVWALLFAGVMGIAAAMVDMQALMGVMMLTFPVAFLVTAIVTNMVIAYLAPRLLAKK